MRDNLVVSDGKVYFKNVTEFCKHFGINRNRFYKWKDNKFVPKYVKKFGMLEFSWQDIVRFDIKMSIWDRLCPGDDKVKYPK